MNTIVKLFAVISIVFYFVAALNDLENKLIYLTLIFCNLIILKLEIIEEKL